MGDIIFTAGDTKQFIVGAVTKNWGGNSWSVLTEKERLNRIKQIHMVVNTLMADDSNPKIKIEK